MQYIAFDSHKHYTLASVEPEKGGEPREFRIGHERGAIKQFLQRCEPGSPVAIETIGNWYWIVDEIEEAGMQPRLVHARRAKMMLACTNKTDKLDARGLNRLQRAGTLPCVWIPTAEIRDKRDLPRTSMVLVRLRTGLKTRIHALLGKYGLSGQDDGNVFTWCKTKMIADRVALLPEHAGYAAQRLLEQLQFVQGQIRLFEERITRAVLETPEIRLVMTLPGVGHILGTVIALEVGNVERFPSASHLASYVGTVPRVHSSGDKTRYGQVRNDVNRYLKWAFVEAANTISANHKKWPDRHVVRLYDRLIGPKGHQKAIGAVARHLAEATYWVLKKQTPYFEPKTLPKKFQVSSTGRSSASPS